MEKGYPVIVRMSQSEFDAGKGTALDNERIEISNPTGEKFFNSGAAGVAPVAEVTAANINTVMATAGGAGWEKTQITTASYQLKPLASGASRDFHIESGGSLATLVVADWPKPTSPQVDLFKIRNFSGVAKTFQVSVGAGQFAGIVTADDDSATPAATSYSIRNDGMVVVSIDSDGWVQVVPSAEVSQAEFDAVSNASVKLTGDQTVAGKKTFSTLPEVQADAITANQIVRKTQHDTKADDNSILRIRGQSLSLSRALAHPVNFTSNAGVTGADGAYSSSASSEYNASFQAWQAFDNVDTTDHATQGVTGATEWHIQLNMPVGKIVSRVIARGRASGIEGPTAFRIEGSNDAFVTKTTLHTGTMVLNNAAQTFDFTNTKVFSAYRFVSTASSGTNPGLSRLEFHESVYSATVPAATTSIAGTMSATDKTKLDGVASGAEVNVQADWNQAITTADDFIKNKPSLTDSSLNARFRTSLNSAAQFMASGTDVNTLTGVGWYNIQNPANGPTTTNWYYIENVIHRTTSGEAVDTNYKFQRAILLTDTGIKEYSRISIANTWTAWVERADLGDVQSLAPLASPTFTGTVSGITATMVGLGNVNNTSDANKPISTAQQTALDGKSSTSHVHSEYLPKTSLAVTPTVLHPENFAAATATGTAGTYTVSASSQFDANYAGWKAFDSSDTTDWATQSVTTNFWVRIVLPAARIVTSVILRGRNAGIERITSWILQGSNDGTAWTDLLTSTTVLGNTAQTFPVTNATAYTQYRLFANTAEASNPGLSRMTLRGDSYAFNNPVV